jgi:hypothetical protein
MSACRFRDCDQPAAVPVVSDTFRGGLGLCLQHDQELDKWLGMRQHTRSLLGSADDNPNNKVYIARVEDSTAENHGLIKIGSSTNPRTRIRSLCARLLSLEDGGRRREGELHTRFWRYRLHGEWFAPVEELLDYACQTGYTICESTLTDDLHVCRSTKKAVRVHEDWEWTQWRTREREARRKSKEDREWLRMVRPIREKQDAARARERAAAEVGAAPEP